MTARTLTEHLVLYAAGAAEPGDAAFVESVLATDPDGRARYQSLLARRRQLFPPSRWPVPATMLQAEAAWMDTEPLGVGDVLTLRLPEAAPTFRPLLVRGIGSDADRVLLPLYLVDWPTLDELPSDGRHHLLELVLDEPSGVHRYTVVLVPPDWPVDPAQPEELRWEPARAALEAGELSGASVVVEVGPRRL